MIDDSGINCDLHSMSLAATYPHIVKEEGHPALLEGHARTRVAMIVINYLWRGWSAEEISLKYPYLTLAELHAAMTYYFNHREEIDPFPRETFGEHTRPRVSWLAPSPATSLNLLHFL